MTTFYLAQLSAMQHGQSRDFVAFKIGILAIFLSMHSISASGARSSIAGSTKKERQYTHSLEFYGETTAGSGNLPPTSAFVARGPIAQNSQSDPRPYLNPYLLAGVDSFSGGFAGAGAASQLPKLESAPGLYGSMRLEFRKYEAAREQWLLAASGESTHENRARLTGDLWGGIDDETTSASLQIRAAADAVRQPGWIIGAGGGQRWTSWTIPSPFVFGEARVALITSPQGSAGTWATLLGKQFLKWPRQTEWTLAIGGTL